MSDEGDSMYVRNWLGRALRVYRRMGFPRAGFLALIVSLNLLGMAVAAPTNVGATASSLPLGNQAIPPTFFGMHVHYTHWDLPWPAIPFGAERLWDAEVQWADVNPASGVFDWTHMDQIVAANATHGTTVLYTLGQTPLWASSRPGAPGLTGPGHSAPPRDINDWRAYVRAVAARYKGRIAAYELWNEPNGTDQFWTGSVRDLIDLAAVARDTIKAIDPSALLVGPATTGNVGGSGVGYLDQLLGAGLGKYVDVIAYHSYPNPGDAPEDLVNLTGQIKATMSKYGIQKPLWDSESNWMSKQFTDHLAQAYVARQELMHWYLGYSRHYWYAWDDHGVTLQLSRADDVTPTPGAVAYKAVQGWMVGGVMSTCQRSASGVWTATLIKDGLPRHVAWLETDSATTPFAVPTAWAARRVTDLNGNQTAIVGGSVRLDAAPVLLS